MTCLVCIQSNPNFPGDRDVLLGEDKNKRNIHAVEDKDLLDKVGICFFVLILGGIPSHHIIFHHITTHLSSSKKNTNICLFLFLLCVVGSSFLCNPPSCHYYSLAYFIESTGPSATV